MIQRSLYVACAALAIGSFGCSNTVRYMTATHWLAPSGAAGEAAPAVAAPAAPAAPEAKSSGEAAPAPSTAPAPAAGKSQRVLYITYWEGSCSSGALGFGRGCSKGDSHVKRCNVQADNSLACVDEKDIGNALATK